MHDKHCKNQGQPIIIMEESRHDDRHKKHREQPIRVNRTVFVDQQFGNDSTGKRTYMGKPFQTILSALQSAQDGDTIWVRASNLPSGTPAGTYIQDMAFPMSNIPTSIKTLNDVINTDVSVTLRTPS